MQGKPYSIIANPLVGDILYGGKIKMKKNRIRNIPIYVRVTPAEHEQIRARMADAGLTIMSVFIRKLALTGYVLNVDLTPVRELCSLQRRCSNNLNQIAVRTNTYGGVTPQEIVTLQKDYALLNDGISEVLRLLTKIVAL
jgi:hypothetical protein